MFCLRSIYSVSCLAVISVYLVSGFTQASAGYHNNPREACPPGSIVTQSGECLPLVDASRVITKTANLLRMLLEERERETLDTHSPETCPPEQIQTSRGRCLDLDEAVSVIIGATEKICVMLQHKGEALPSFCAKDVEQKRHFGQAGLDKR